MTRPDTGQRFFESFQQQIRKARATASRDPRSEPCSGNAQRPARSAEPDVRAAKQDVKPAPARELDPPAEDAEHGEGHRDLQEIPW